MTSDSHALEILETIFLGTGALALVLDLIVRLNRK